MPNNFAVHDRCTGCSGKASPGVKSYAAYAEDAWPYQTSMGIYNCRRIGGTGSYSKHACGDAYDQGIPVNSNGTAILELGEPVVEALAANGIALGISQIIYNRKIYDRRSPNGRTYKGVHPHYNHLHISFTHAAGQNLTYATIVSILGDPGDEMNALKLGDKGHAVGWYQTALNEKSAVNPKLKVDNDFGPATETAVKQYQGSTGSFDKNGVIDGALGPLIAKDHPSQSGGAKAKREMMGNRGYKVSRVRRVTKIPSIIRLWLLSQLWPVT